jgi:tol-pal system protein YbgF
MQLPGGALPPGARPVPPQGAPVAPSLGAAAPAAPTRNDAKSDFDFARELFKRGDFELAEAAFREFLRNHRRDRREPEATFWLGESYFNRTRYREAAEQYLTVTTKFPNSARAAEAMLKLGMSLRGLGANAEACGTFDQIARKYPKASASVKSAVERERARGKC